MKLVVLKGILLVCFESCGNDKKGRGSNMYSNSMMHLFYMILSSINITSDVIGHNPTI